MKLYIAQATCSLAAQLVANELGLSPELIHFDVHNGTTSNGQSFTDVNPLAYVPVLELNNDASDRLTETTVVTSYLADQHPEAGLIPAAGTLERARYDQLLVFLATEIAQKHIPLMRKLLTSEGAEWTRNKLVKAYTELDQRLADGRTYITGDKFTVADAYVWGTMWHERSGAKIDHLKNLMAYVARVEARPSAQKALKDEAELVALHRSRAAA
ncbi:glutathione S-transferase C-terminal domain-containing protein [Bradyrhizobium sp. 31Argb]|uniref:glutathione S-transferase family protein n=1 Tax=unclassified Bradyrhizobium TaxID=2631580 RepID=UPI00102EB51A|nr:MULTISPECIES: glutathione S-transferase C-terminal domain-containing protein [unclassified Bradyrhizobium]MDI4231791.1 glutathione S-transferase family protein [Bradyrhizobium sp. Arg237L]TAI65660.1 glutathione S-transferase [Bradyrhizobium sp. Leo170]